MSNLKNKIVEAIEKNKTKYGFMGTGPVKIILTISDEEIKELKEMDITEQINEFYTWELEGNKLCISYFTPKVIVTP